MNLMIRLLPMSLIYFLLISAKTIEVYPDKEVNVKAEISIPTKTEKPANQPTPNLFKRLMQKISFKKLKQIDVAEADNYAKKASTWGLIAIISTGASLLFPPLLVFSLIAGIVAMSFGRKAIAGNTQLLDKARSGKSKG